MSVKKNGTKSEKKKTVEKKAHAKSCNSDMIKIKDQLKHEIEERMHVEEALQESRATIQALIDAVPESMLLLDSKGTVLALNEIAAQRMDKSKEGILGLSVFDFLSSELAEKRAENLKQVTASGKQLCFTDERDGRNFYCSLEPVLSADG
ncbi:MAG: PAS domain-containing protein, partial [Desulfobacteraceae bacterium]